MCGSRYYSWAEMLLGDKQKHVWGTVFICWRWSVFDPFCKLHIERKLKNNPDSPNISIYTPYVMWMGICTEVLGVMKASGVISLGIGPLPGAEFVRKSAGAGRDGIFLRSVWEPLPESLSELWSVRWSENPAVNTKYEMYFTCVAIFDIQLHDNPCAIHSYVFTTRVFLKCIICRI